jgi:hypothetical protein
MTSEYRNVYQNTDDANDSTRSKTLWDTHREEGESEGEDGDEKRAILVRGGGEAMIVCVVLTTTATATVRKVSQVRAEMEC